MSAKPRNARIRRFTGTLGLAETDADVYPRLEWARTVRVGGLLWLVGVAISVAFLPLDHGGLRIAPHRPLLFVVAAVGVLLGVVMVARPASLGPRGLIRMGYGGAAALGGALLAIGPDGPFHLLLLMLAAYQAAVHPARRAVRFLAFLVFVDVVALPFAATSGADVVDGLATAVLILIIGGMTLIYAHEARMLMSALDDERGRAEQAARTDPLTGLGNRRAFIETLSGHLATNERYGRPLSVLLADVDGFKSINDTWGHDFGDDALAHIASMLKGELREPDACFRWGGDEFVVIMPETDLAGAERVLERLVAALIRSDGKATAPLSITGGAAERRHGETADALLARADAELLSRKRMLYDVREGPHPAQRSGPDASVIALPARIQRRSS